MSVNLTPLFFLVGLGITSSFIEKFLSKSGNESSSYYVGLATFLIAALVVINMIKKMFDELSTFLRF
jgi:hypothetical protein